MQSGFCAVKQRDIVAHAIGNGGKALGKKTIVAALGGFAMAALAAVPAFGQMFEKITVVNSTGYTISEVYIAPSANRSWEEDVLDRDVLADGQEVEIDFRRSENTCDWDLMVVYDDGEQAIWQGLDLCEDWHFELFYNARTGDTRLVSSH
ncbi:argininosuccinate lyase [Porphyrobacter sp. CACIAM 03H1]|jgi:hypothetical protein|nr:argininosuccinate lyase [Porphyrobacter sp. CACIAM 03H1]